MDSTPFVTPDGRRTDRSIAQVTKDQRLASFTLGVTPTSVLELANVGATLASSGRWCPPSPIEKITDPAGNPVPLPETPCEQVVEPGLANTLLTALSKDDTMGTAAAAAGQVRWSRPMAGKTGTTQEHKSAAFIGVVPQMSGAVITFDNSNAPKPLCDGAGAPFPCRTGNIFGGKTPAETWFGTMVPLLADQPVLPLPSTEQRYVRGGVQLDVPDVVGEDVDDARAILKKAGWPTSVRAASRDDDDDDDDDDDGPGLRPGLRPGRHRGRAEPVRHRAARRVDPPQRRLTRLRPRRPAPVGGPAGSSSAAGPGSRARPPRTPGSAGSRARSGRPPAPARAAG